MSSDIVCPPCDEGHRHAFDDDWPFLALDVSGLASGSRLGDPCVWCEHEKCGACPLPRAALRVVQS